MAVSNSAVNFNLRRYIEAWNTASVEFMNMMFSGTSAFAQDITGWTTPSLTSSAVIFIYTAAWLAKFERIDGSFDRHGPPSAWQLKE